MNSRQRIIKREKQERILDSRFMALNVGRMDDYQKMNLEIKKSLVESLEINRKNGHLDLSTFEGKRRFELLMQDHLELMEYENSN